MDSTNSKLHSLAARLVHPNHESRNFKEEDDDDAIFAELEDEIENDSNAAMREVGLKMFQRELQSMKEMQSNKHGQYSEITDEKEVVQVSAHESRCVIHFFHMKFKRCEIMDKHLAKIAPKYFNTRFARVFVDNVPWLIEKLRVKVLPCVICFVDGVAKDRLIGFEDLGNTDAFDTAALELRLLHTGVIEKADRGSLSQVFRVTSSRKRNPTRGDDDEVFDL